MARSQILMVLLCSTIYVAQSAKAPIFEAKKCTKNNVGCQTDTQCPTNSHCSYDGGSCGFCVCEEGFKNQGNKCNAIKGYTTTTTQLPSTTTEVLTSTSAAVTESSTTTGGPTTVTTTQATTTGTTTQGPPPTPDPINCVDFDCSASPPVQSNDANPLEVRSSLVNSTNPNCKRALVIPPRPCQLKEGGSCFGTYCLTVSAGNDYCICPYYRVDRQCAVDKPGTCSKATGDVPAGYAKLQGTRLQNPNNPDSGSIYARHFASTLNDCIKLCQWTAGSCRSVNFGQIAGANVCEMLSVSATEKNLLAKWLIKANGWQYAQVGPAQ